MDDTRKRDPAGSDNNALQKISNGLVHLMSEFYGRGPTRAKTYILDDAYVCCVMHDVFTTAEQTLIDADEHELVRRVRIAYQVVLAERFKAVVAEALGRRVLTYQSQVMF